MHISLSVCVCVSVCLSVREDISGTTRAIFTIFSFYVHVARWGNPKCKGQFWGFFFPIDYASYGFRGGNAPWFMCWLRRYIKCLFVCLLNFLPHFLHSLLSSFLMHWILLIYFLACLLPDLSIYFFQDRPVPFPGRRLQEARRRPNLTLFFGSFYVVVGTLFCYGYVFAFVVFVSVFQY